MVSGSTPGLGLRGGGGRRRGPSARPGHRAPGSGSRTPGPRPPPLGPLGPAPAPSASAKVPAAAAAPLGDRGAGRSPGLEERTREQTRPRPTPRPPRTLAIRSHLAQAAQAQAIIQIGLQFCCSRMRALSCSRVSSGFDFAVDGINDLYGMAWICMAWHGLVMQPDASVVASTKKVKKHDDYALYR